MAALGAGNRILLIQPALVIHAAGCEIRIPEIFPEKTPETVPDMISSKALSQSCLTDQCA
jgi:hypothetical protein